MFIVEGLDYAGKTTVLNGLQKKIRDQRWQRWFGSPIISEVQRWGKLPADFEYCTQYIVACHSAQLCDRFILSELAYGQVFRGGANPLFDSHARRRVQRELNVTGSVTLLVKCDWESTEMRAKERCLSEFDAAMKVRTTYEQGTGAFQAALQDRAIGRRGGSFLGEYDTSRRIMMEHARPNEATEETRLRYQKACDDVLDFYLEEWKLHLLRSQEVLRVAPRSWGYLWPKVLFVGEACNGPQDARPFSGDNGSSRTLTDLLDLADIGEKDCYFANAYTFKHLPLLTKAAVVTLAPKLVVALGNEAHEYLTKIDVPHAEFPHPQWVGRFHRKEFNDYGMKLKELCQEAVR